MLLFSSSVSVQIILIVYRFPFRSPDFDGSDRVGYSGARGRVRGRRRVHPAQDQGRVPLLLRHTQGRRLRR